MAPKQRLRDFSEYLGGGDLIDAAFPARAPAGELSTTSAAAALTTHDDAPMTELGAWEFRASARTVRLSPELCALLDLHGRADWLLIEVLARWKPVDRPALAAALQDAVRGGRRLAFDGRLAGPTGPEAWLRLVGEPVFEHGECVGLQGEAQLAIGDRR